MYANLVILGTPVRIISYQVVSLGHLGGKDLHKALQKVIGSGTI